jgi:branched-chain amino acid transport system substrate-binding protein
MTLAIVLLVAGLVVGGGIGYFAAPKGSDIVTQTEVVKEVPTLPLKGANVKLGYIASDTTGLETGKPSHEQIWIPDYNKYAALLGYGTTFQYMIDDAQGQANTHLEKVQGFKSAGITIYEGGGWSSQAQSSLSYTNTNSMLMWSSSSTSPTLAIANDRLYRMCPADTALAPALADIMWQFGIKEAATFQRGDSWGDGIINLFVPAFTAKGGKMTGANVRYAAEATEFTNYLQQVDAQIKDALDRQGGDHLRVGMVILSFNEAPVIIKQASQFDSVYNIHWYGSDGTALSQRVMDDSPDEANHIGIYSMLSHQTPSTKFDDLQKRYVDLVKQQFSTYTAYSYDIGTVIVNSVLEAQSQKADDILPIQMGMSLNTFGAGGWCKLNEFGDRAPPPFDVWGFFKGDTKPSVSKVVCTYDNDYKVANWDAAVLGYTPKGP